jgi:hypothetical protein
MYVPKGIRNGGPVFDVRMHGVRMHVCAYVSFENGQSEHVYMYVSKWHKPRQQHQRMYMRVYMHMYLQIKDIPHQLCAFIELGNRQQVY